jgi:hypothetical protein
MKKLLAIYAAALILSACTKKPEEAPPAEAPAAAEAPADAPPASSASSESTDK